MRQTTLLADWAALAQADRPMPGQAFADALVRACARLPDEILRVLPALPDDAAATLASEPFAGQHDGAYLAADWLESYTTALALPLAEIDNGWDVSDGESVYFCPIVQLVEDPHERDDRGPFVRLDEIQRWPDPEPV